MSSSALTGNLYADPSFLLADAQAENVALNRELDATRRELNSERLVLGRMMHTDPSLPISLLSSLLSIARRKREDGAALAASQHAHEDGLARLELIRAREDWLMAAASASDGPTFFGHSRRWQSLRTERTEAENALRLLAQQVTLMRERLAKLEVVEKHAWGAMSVNATRPHSNRSNRPSSRQSDVTSRTLSVQISSKLVPTQDATHPVSSSGMIEKSSSPPPDSASLPEIPDDPTFIESVSAVQYKRRRTDGNYDSSVVIPTHPSIVPRISHPTSSSRLSGRANVTPLLISNNQNRDSTASSLLTSPRSRSSAADLSVGPLTPLSSRMELPEPQIEDWNNEAYDRGKFRAPNSFSTSRPSMPLKPGESPPSSSSRPTPRVHRESQSTSFEFTPFAIAPLVIVPSSSLNRPIHPSFTESTPSRPPLTASRSASSLKSGAAHENGSAGGAFKKLVGRSIFRSVSSNSATTSNRSPTPIAARPPQNGLRSSGLDQRLEPLVESWVMEQLEVPPPSPSPRELAAYYSENEATDQRKARRPFGGLLKPSVGGWLGGGSR